jgi:hypothetical protein
VDTVFQPTPQEIALGTKVAVRVNDHNRTPHTGIIATATWHFKLGKWFYFLLENVRKVSKRYAAEDLQVIE